MERDNLVVCRAWSLVFMIVGIVAMFYANWTVSNFAFLVCFIYQVGGFIIQEIRNART